MTGDLAIRRMAAAAVLLVAAIAAVISYLHIEHLALAHGQSALAAMLLPLSIDGTVAAASLVLLRAARTGLAAPHLAQVMLGLAVVATLAANVANGARYGLAGALLSGWPAVAFIGSAEMALGMVRRARQAAPAAVEPNQLGAAPAAVPAVSGQDLAESGVHLNGSGLHPAEAEPFAGDLARGEVPSLRRIRAELHCGQPRAQEIQGRLAALTGDARA